MATNFIDVLRETPVDAIGEDASQPLILTKTYLDSLIAGYKENSGNSNIAIDELTVEGLDANQVWFQTKMVIDNVEGDLMERIQALRDAMDAHDEEESVDEEQNEDEEIANEDNEIADESVRSLDGQEQEQEQEEKEDDDDDDDDDDEIIEGKDDYVDSGLEDNVVKGQESPEEEEDEPQQRYETDADGLNDQFFNIEDFNRQTLAQENNLDDDEDQNNDDGEEVDYFADLPSDEDEEADYYEDFFDKPKTNKSATVSQTDGMERSESNRNDGSEDNGISAMNSMKLDLFEDADDAEEEEEDSDNGTETKIEKLSTYQKQQLEIQKQIAQLEAEAVAEKKWALKGEVRAKQRPADALLTEDLEFERTAKPVPVITTEVTESLEDMIRKRIKEFNFDDLQRKTINDFAQRGQRQKVEISDVKSSKSLAEIYADDAQGVSEENDISEQLQKSHDEITELFNNITYKLDALSSAHFIPRPAKKSLEVRVESAAITMEDAQPLSMSSASTLAPQEVYKSGKADNDNEIRLKNGTVMSREELTREDKNRLRRSVKRKRAKNMANHPSKKKSKKDDVIETLSRAKNITVINKAGEKRDIKGKAASSGNSNNVTNFRL
ncbi:similar to Saccharomyces cerevisiae YJR002W MPP10 Component of the SSU processome and 90S preribosome [Maudiozyma barnettii]|uniref:U3 small nucleolar ribonucleoprotein protein MPP10 n=1 Tax=Maudiozyma barnettii TaxID=61262 RepID=A0A8H2VBB2_9SACH|nr:rRNA-processing protein MPP10 [Kazachstania barnettii]CAB4252126.1 similar to Saccharomyces cerevisiae YJR002W MPP10 Component of the SSU processome and 90S preribosome [Kazachstania barnettii]CAD1778669.1 similar to Saccharomyces cerevisiae YJR002W MPP10 Component of the SSU processome and 90S preribosome [Kazachstania barnettii]